jgi:hypothetical protein
VDETSGKHSPEVPVELNTECHAEPNTPDADILKPKRSRRKTIAMQEGADGEALVISRATLLKLYRPHYRQRECLAERCTHAAASQAETDTTQGARD